MPVPKSTHKPTPRASHRKMRGLAAISAAALLLAVLVLFLIPGVFRGSILNFPQPSTTPTEPPSPIPVNPYGPEDFTYEDGYLTCMAGQSILGVDVSSHQEEIDWHQVRNAGMEFAIIRIGYRGYTSGGIYEDAYARANLKGAREAGLKVGVYFYSQAVSVAEAAEEAAFCLRFLEDEPLDFPVVYDWEYVNRDARTADMDKQTLTQCTQVFCDLVENAGYRSMIYFNASQGRDLLDLEDLLEYPWWLALYSDTMNYPHKIDLWQYTSEGSVPGIKGKADINLWFPE